MSLAAFRLTDISQSYQSTLLGVLTKGVLDDGRGKARINLFR